MLRIAVASPVRSLPALPANRQHSGDARFFGCRGRPCDDRLAIEEKALGPDHPCSPLQLGRRRQCVAQLRSGEEEPAACIDHRLRATRAISAEHYALAYVLLSGAPPHPRRGPAHRRQRREAAGLARQAGSSLDCYGAAVRQVTAHDDGRGSALECLLFGLPIEPDDAGLLCAHYRPKSECREDGHRE